MIAKSPIRFGFLGAGQVAYWAADCLKNVPEARLAAIHDVSEERMLAFAEKCEVPKTYATAAELFADPEIDAVYIAVPNSFHAPLSKQALAAGKHVLLDKPFALNLAEARDVVEAARASGKVFTLGMNQRFIENHQKIRALSEAGTFGEIYHAKAFWMRRSGIPKLGTWFGHRALSGGGCLCDIGVHLLDLCLYCMDNFEPVSVFGTTYTKFGNRGLGEGNWGMSDRDAGDFDVDDFATALIRLSNGATIALDVSWACHAEESNRMDVHLYGTEAGASASSCKVFRNDPSGGNYEVVESIEAPVKYPHNDRFANFVNHLLGKEELCVTMEQALAVQAVLDAIEESSRTGREVLLAPAGHATRAVPPIVLASSEPVPA